MCQFTPYQLLPVVTCVGVWVVTEWSVSCLGNLQVIPKSCMKFVSLPPSPAACGDLCRSMGIIKWSVSCLDNSQVSSLKAACYE